MAETTTPLLDLRTLTARPFLRINGTRYELRVPEELSVYDGQLLTVAGERLQRLAAEAATAPEADAELSELLDQVCRRVLIDVPEAIHQALTQRQRLAIVEAFTRASAASSPAAAARAARRPTGARSSRGSSTPTEATL